MLVLNQSLSDKAVEQDVDEEIDRFNAYFKSLQKDGTGLSNPERAAIKTFCAYLLGLGPNNPRSNPPPTERDPNASTNRS
jgi:hypothetical protein